MKWLSAHRRWLAVALASTALCLAPLMAPTVDRAGARLTLGAAAALAVLFAAVRGARLRLLRLPLGSAGGRLRAHLWIGGLSLAFAVAHGGGRLGGPLSTALTIILGLVVLGGLLGAALQRVLTREINALSAETIFDLDRGALSLRRRACEALWASCGTPPEVAGEAAALRELGVGPRSPAILQNAASHAGQAELLRFYGDVLIPYLRRQGRGPSPLATAADAALAFDVLESRLAAPLRPVLAELRRISDRLRTARRQHRLHRFLHGWLLFHAPLSMALLVLLITHVVMALRY